MTEKFCHHYVNKMVSFAMQKGLENALILFDYTLTFRDTKTLLKKKVYHSILCYLPKSHARIETITANVINSV